MNGVVATLSGIVAAVSLFLTAASLVVLGGALFALLLFGLFLLALVGVFSGFEDRAVRQYDPSLDGERWRNGS